MASPYEGVPEEGWQAVTDKLIEQHPLTPDLIRDAALVSWERLWNSTVGDAHTGFKLQEVDPPATVVGYFFEKIFAKELAKRLPGEWRGGTGSEKDLHCIKNDAMSVEMKSSGQLGYKVYGNRSYGQKVENAEAAKKDKSGYYITINFHKQKLTRLRFGWIDADDWKAQASATGQMAGLPDAVYEHKLKTINGDYMLDAPIQLLHGVGGKAAQELEAHGIHTIGDLLKREAIEVPPKHLKHWKTAKERY